MKDDSESAAAWLRKHGRMIAILGSAAVLTAISPYAIERIRSGSTPDAIGDDSAIEWEAPAAIDDNWALDLDNADGSDEGGAGSVGGGSLAGLDCIIEPSRKVAIRSPVIGRIESIEVDRADLVAEGELLVRLESRVEEAAVEIASARATMSSTLRSKEARRELGTRRKVRAEQLYEDRALSLDLRDEVITEAKVAGLQFEEAKDQLRLARLERDQAEAVLARRHIKSPISGVVTERLMTSGEVVDEEVILRIAQIDPLSVEVILPATRFGTIDVGSKVAVTPEIPGDEVHVASVAVVDRVIDAASGTFGIRLDLPNPDLAIPGGLHCEVEFLDDAGER